MSRSPDGCASLHQPSAQSVRSDNSVSLTPLGYHEDDDDDEEDDDEDEDDDDHDHDEEDLVFCL